MTCPRNFPTVYSFPLESAMTGGGEGGLGFGLEGWGTLCPERIGSLACTSVIDVKFRTAAGTFWKIFNAKFQLFFCYFE